MAEDTVAGIFGKAALGSAVGFVLYVLVTGRGSRGDGRGRDSSLPPLPRDAEPLLYVVVESAEAQKLPRPPDLFTRARRDVRFRRLDLGAAKLSPDEIYRRMSDLLRREQGEGTPPISVDELIARVRAGGRDDVRLISTGAIRTGTRDDALDALMSAGIKHWRLWVEALGDRKVGQLPKPPRWDLYGKGDPIDNPVGTASWGLALPEPHVSGDGRGHYGLQWSGYPR